MEVADIKRVLDEHKKNLAMQVLKEDVQEEFDNIKDWLIRCICYDISRVYDEHQQVGCSGEQTYSYLLQSDYNYTPEIVGILRTHLKEECGITVEVIVPRMEFFDIVGLSKNIATTVNRYLDVTVNLKQFF